MIGLYTNLSNMASTQWSGFEFNSMCRFNGICLGGNDNGLFTLSDAGTDEYIDTDTIGTEINGYFELMTTDLGIPNQKRLRNGYIGHESDGALEVTVSFDDDTSHTFTVSPEGTENRQRSAKFNCRRDQKGRYFSVKVQNTNGCDFSVDSIDVTPIILGRKPSGS